MKVFFTALWALVCAVILIYGHSYWSDRTNIQTDAEKKAAAKQVTQNAPKVSGVQSDELLAKAKNWPDTAKQQFEKALKQNKPFKILFIGSNALGSKDEGMAKSVIQELSKTYGQHIDVTVHTYDGTSKDFVANNRQIEVAAEKAQVIVFEPFLLNDNGYVAIGDSLSNITKVIDGVKAANPDTTFILQPSFPLYQAIYYPRQAEKLKEFADENHIAYLDHWTAWPDTANAELTDFLTPDQTGPNDKGNHVWSQYLINYFISK